MMLGLSGVLLITFSLVGLSLSTTRYRSLFQMEPLQVSGHLLTGYDMESSSERLTGPAREDVSVLLTEFGYRGYGLRLASQEEWLQLHLNDSSCLNHLQDCDKGVVVAFWVYMCDDTGPAYILSTGGLNGKQGYTVFIQDGRVEAHFTTATQTWHIRATAEVPPRVWVHVGFLWHLSQGTLEGFVGESVGFDQLEEGAIQGSPHTATATAEGAYIGRLSDGSEGADGSHGGFILDELWILETSVSVLMMETFGRGVYWRVYDEPNYWDLPREYNFWSPDNISQPQDMSAVNPSAETPSVVSSLCTLPPDSSVFPRVCDTLADWWTGSDSVPSVQEAISTQPLLLKAGLLSAFQRFHVIVRGNNMFCTEPTGAACSYPPVQVVGALDTFTNDPGCGFQCGPLLTCRLLEDNSPHDCRFYCDCTQIQSQFCNLFALKFNPYYARTQGMQLCHVELIV